MRNNIKSSQGKIIGFTEIQEDYIIIHDNSKSEFIIKNKDIIQRIREKDMSEQILLTLYDNYYLSCGEIASLYGVCYSNINKIIKRLDTKTTPHEGRRNRKYKNSLLLKKSKQTMCGHQVTEIG